jgi:hypothetical protein
VFEVVNWIQLAQDMIKWRATVNRIRTFGFGNMRLLIKQLSDNYLLRKDFETWTWSRNTTKLQPHTSTFVSKIISLLEGQFAEKGNRWGCHERKWKTDTCRHSYITPWITLNWKVVTAMGDLIPDSQSLISRNFYNKSGSKIDLDEHQTQ